MHIYYLIKVTHKDPYLVEHLNILFQHFLLLKEMEFIYKEAIDNMEIQMYYF